MCPTQQLSSWSLHLAQYNHFIFKLQPVTRVENTWPMAMFKLLSGLYHQKWLLKCIFISQFSSPLLLFLLFNIQFIHLHIHTGHYFYYGLVKYRVLFHEFPNHYLAFYMIKCETNIAFTALKLIIHSPTRYDTSEVKLILCLIKQCREHYNHPTLVFPFKIIQLENPH